MSNTTTSGYNVSITNLTTNPIQITSCTVTFSSNNSETMNPVMLDFMGTASITVPADKTFSDFVLNMTIGTQKIGINLNSDHWFGGASNYHYPGQGCIGIYILGYTDNNNGDCVLVYNYGSGNNSYSSTSGDIKIMTPIG